MRLLLAMTARYDWEAQQGDVNTAFLSADMDTELYAAVPNWFDAAPDELGIDDMTVDEVMSRLKQLAGYSLRKVENVASGAASLREMAACFHAVV